MQTSNSLFGTLGTDVVIAASIAAAVNVFVERPEVRAIATLAAAAFIYMATKQAQQEPARTRIINVNPLPKEIWGEVLNYCTRDDLLVMGCVNKQFHELAEK